MAGPEAKRGATPPPAGIARVIAGDRAWVLGPRARLTFGRADCDVPFGSSPPDLTISRAAGILAESEGAIVVRNTGRHPLLLLSADGNTQVILAPSNTSSAGMREFLIVAVGNRGQRHEIKVIHLRGAGSNSPGQDTVQPSMHLTPTERRLLAALCEGRLRSGNPNEPFPSYREIAQRVNRDDNYVRSRLSTVRNNLAALGVPGLAREEPGGPPRRLPDFIVRLGEWVLAAGLINRTDLILLDSKSGSPPPGPAAGSPGAAAAPPGRQRAPSDPAPRSNASPTNSASPASPR